MQTVLIIALSLHILASVFWAGTSFTLARTGGAGGEQLFRPQMGAAVIAVLTGGYLGHLVHGGSFGPAERVLAVGALAALVAAGVQGAIGGRAVRSLRSGATDPAAARSRIAIAQRIAAALLAVTAVCMGAARYV
jgi:heme A synthase